MQIIYLPQGRYKAFVVLGVKHLEQNMLVTW